MTKTVISEKTEKPFKRKTNLELRPREYLTIHEVEQLRKAARSMGRHGHRDDTLILMMFTHGLRINEVVNLKWAQINFQSGLMHVNRLKGSAPSTHPMRALELRALKKMQRIYIESPYIFLSERGAPITDRAVHIIVARAGKLANFDFSVHPHMLRHATGYYLANNGVDTRAIQSYLGHKSIRHTVQYTQLSPERFNNFFMD